MGSSWPLQKVQPLGGKFQLMILISPRNGSDIFSFLLAAGRKSPLLPRFCLISPCNYTCEGKIPNSERIKLTTRNGTMLSCGCDPPEGSIASVDMAFVGAVPET